MICNDFTFKLPHKENIVSLTVYPPLEVSFKNRLIIFLFSENKYKASGFSLLLIKSIA